MQCFCLCVRFSRPIKWNWIIFSQHTWHYLTVHSGWKTPSQKDTTPVSLINNRSNFSQLQTYGVREHCLHTIISVLEITTWIFYFILSFLSHVNVRDTQRGNSNGRCTDDLPSCSCASHGDTAQAEDEPDWLEKWMFFHKSPLSPSLMWLVGWQWDAIYMIHFRQGRFSVTAISPLSHFVNMCVYIHILIYMYCTNGMQICRYLQLMICKCKCIYLYRYI